MSSPSRVPGSFASITVNCRRRTARATALPPIPVSTSIAPNRSGVEGRRSEDRSPASNLLRPAGCNAHASRSSRTNGSKPCSVAGGTSISTRRSRAGDPPPFGLIEVSSSAISPGGKPSILRKNARRRVRTSNNGSSRFVPATARRARPPARSRRKASAGLPPRGVHSARACCAVPGCRRKPARALLASPRRRGGGRVDGSGGRSRPAGTASRRSRGRDRPGSRRCRLRRPRLRARPAAARPYSANAAPVASRAHRTATRSPERRS